MKNEYYWSICLEPGWVQAGIWTTEDQQIKIISNSPPGKWEEENLVHTIDAALSAAVEDLPDQTKEPSKVVFGVRPDWVEEGKIKKEHLTLIRKVCTDLSLSPTGFVVIPEAITHSIKIKDGNPLSGVVIGISEDDIDVSLFKLGNLVGSVKVGRSVSVVDDTLEGLARLNDDQALPTRFLLYNGSSKDLEDVKQALVKADWKEVAKDKIKILHDPQIEIVSPDEKTDAVSIAGASELGEIKGVLGQAEDSDDNPVNPVEMGEESNIKESDDLTAADLGFVVDGEVEEKATKSDNDEPELARQDFKKPKLSKPKFKAPSFAFLKNVRNKSALDAPKEPKISKVGLDTGSKMKRVVIGLVALLVVAAVGLGVAWWFIPKAQVTIFISPRTLEQSEVLTLEEGLESADFENRLFPATLETLEVTGEKTVSSTGTKTVGESAKGTVTIRNDTAAGIVIDAGTELIGPNDLKFVIDETASVSGKTGIGEPGTATLNATAASIGAEYNLASGESMSVEDYSVLEVDARVEASFSGGSSEEVVAVSQNDIDKLDQELSAELKRKAISEIEGQIGSDDIFISDAVEVVEVDSTYSASVGEEVNAVTLSLTLEAQGLTIPEQTINQFTRSVLEGQVPDGYNLRDEQVETDFILVDEVSEGIWDFDVSISANLLPEIDIDKIKRDVAGRYPTQARNILAQIAGYTEAEVKIKPRFPGRLGNIPRILDNITIEVVADR